MEDLKRTLALEITLLEQLHVLKGQSQYDFNLMDGPKGVATCKDRINVLIEKMKTLATETANHNKNISL